MQGCWLAEEGRGGVQHWVHHRGSNSTPPSQPCDEALPPATPAGRGVTRPGVGVACPPVPGTAPTTDTAFAQSTCQGLRAGPTEPTVPKFQPLDVGIGGQHRSQSLGSLGQRGA